MKIKRNAAHLLGFAAAVSVGLVLWWGSNDTARILPVSPMLSGALPSGENADGTSVFWPSGDDGVGQGVTGVAVGPDGTVYVLHRANRPFNGDITPIAEAVIIRLDPETGKEITRLGAGLFAGPHGISVAQDGTIWIADTSLNIIAHLAEDGSLIRIYGAAYPFYLEALLRLRNVFPRLPVPMGKTTFARPTDVVPLPDNRFAVTDGYRNSRLAVFDMNGELVWEVNKRGSEPGAFHLPHGISGDCEGRIYVADRRNARVQVFSETGLLLRVIDSGAAGRPYGIDVGPGDCLVVADGGDSLDLGTEPIASGLRAGFALLTLDGFPILRGGETGDGPNDVLLPHDIAISPTGRAYLADLYAGRVLAIDLSGYCDASPG